MKRKKKGGRTQTKTKTQRIDLWREKKREAWLYHNRFCCDMFIPDKKKEKNKKKCRSKITGES